MTSAWATQSLVNQYTVGYPSVDYDSRAKSSVNIARKGAWGFLWMVAGF